ncbi:MAG: hypothetical protein FJ293_14555 [Planctomycetes bacterium]|nr:hypothetical protein [Planctomycetota bacterium]
MAQQDRHVAVGARRVFAALVPFLAACASDPGECGAGLDQPEFGSAAAETWQRLERVPAAVGADWDDRSGRLSASIDRLFAGRGREWDRTAENVGSLGPWLGDELADDRPPRLFGFFSRQGERASQDAACFPSRAWHSIKLAIE